MEVLRLPGYLDHEKHAIARQYLIPRQLEKAGVSPASVAFEPDVVPAIVRQYTREAGVRELERRVARLARKVARQRVASKDDAPQSTHLEVKDLHDMLGISPYDPDENTLDDKVGVASGLAYTTVGGEILEIEVSVVPGRGRMHLTGTLGEVMKESASAALSYVRGRARSLGLDPEFLRTRDLHMHIPAGATPKDGPSAGIAIATAVISALTGAAVRGDTAMTGEITLRGRVLGIGGLREKSVAAHRSRIRHVVIPKANARELEELPADVREGLTFHPVGAMDEVLALAFRVPPRPRAADPVGDAATQPAVLAH
jgi:ATP-dependent Lon protease